MADAGMLSIVRCGTTYQVRYASSNPHDMDRQPYRFCRTWPNTGQVRLASH
jgi:hypothetical protein